MRDTMPARLWTIGYILTNSDMSKAYRRVPRAGGWRRSSRRSRCLFTFSGRRRRRFVVSRASEGVTAILAAAAAGDADARTSIVPLVSSQDFPASDAL
jgi:hypothetical protein